MKLPSVLPSVRKSAIKGGASPAPYIGVAFGKGGIYAPAGHVLLRGADGAYRKGADGAYLYGKAS